MNGPEVFVFREGTEDEAASALHARITELGSGAPFVLASKHGERLAARVVHSGLHEEAPRDADQDWAAELGHRLSAAGADLLVAVGGGRTLDLAKLAAARSGLTVVSVPTQLAHDGICSPVAVVPDETGRTQSVGASAPRAVFISLATLRNAPPPTVAAGLGDLLANPLALRDWALAAERGLDEVDGRAWEMAAESFNRIESFLDTDVARLTTDDGFLLELADALVLSGRAMIQSGDSRPASGAEHEISHAIDEVYGGRALHGAQVAFGCIVSVALYGEDHRAFRERLQRLGLPQHPRELGLSHDELRDLLLHAPNTRPGRFTILEDADLDEAKAEALVREIWGREQPSN